MRVAFFLRVSAAFGALFVLAGPAVPQGPLPPLDGLEAGQWELRGAGNILVGAMCLGDRAQLVQPQHRGLSCARTVIGADARSVTIRYSCPGAGSGQTTVRVETPRLAQIESQGLDHGAPFSLRAQARRVGECR